MRSAKFALHVICEGRSPFARALEINRCVEKETLAPSRFIGNSSGVGTNAGQDEHPCAPQEGQTRRETVRSKGGSSDVGYRKRSKGHRWRNGDYWVEAREETPS
jgi:hypothetical protein